MTTYMTILKNTNLKFDKENKRIWIIRRDQIYQRWKDF